MTSSTLDIGLPHTRHHARRIAAVGRFSLFILVVSSVLLLFAGFDTFAQQRFSRRYLVRRNVRFQLTNRGGTITVEGWDRDEIKVSADMDSPVAKFVPQKTSEGLVIDVTRDNRGREDLGDINFHIMVPLDSTVDLQTRRGNIKVNNVRGKLVRAHVSSEGDVELTEIHASTVMASNTMGNILFDGELSSEGSYDFKSGQGDINIRIPGGSAFRLIATAPFTRNITLGAFWNDGLQKMGEGRKIVGLVGDVGDGRRLSSLTITNYRGNISFIPR